jgi:Phosphatidylinositol-specific phospholipase C, X domain
MNVYKKVLIAFIIVLFSYIIWRLIVRRSEIQIETNKEGFDFNIIPTGATAELNGLKDASLKINMQSLQSEYATLPLMEYCIKGSYNSALTGNYISNDMVIYQLGRGCRFFDFEVYYVPDPKTGQYSPQVGYSTDGTFVSMNSENTILLDNVLSALVSSAFSQDAPNNKDPLFINLRIKSNNNDVYRAVASSVDFAISTKLYHEKVDKRTIMSKLMGKVVLMVDKTINYNYTQFTGCASGDKNCYDLTKLINVESGSTNMMLNRYINILNQTNIPLYIKDDNLHTNISMMNLVLPDTLPENAPNPDIKPFVIHYGCQIVPFKFYQQDSGLKQYEQFFNDNNAGIVPMSAGIIYYSKLAQLDT